MWSWIIASCHGFPLKLYTAGDTKATTRRLSDTPGNVWEFGQDSTREEPDYGLQRDKSLIQSAQETVAKALGGGSRGELFLGSCDEAFLLRVC
jgi:hypothetical protein